MWAAQVAGAPILKVPLADPKGAAKHDIKAMLAAASNPGVIYICNPNNPTGTCTPHAEIEIRRRQCAQGHGPPDRRGLHPPLRCATLARLREGRQERHRPAHLLQALRHGRHPHGLRRRPARPAGEDRALRRPERPAHHRGGRGQGQPARCRISFRRARRSSPTSASRPSPGSRARATRCTPSESNCFMLDVRRPGKEVQAALAEKDMFVGRIWPAWPNSVRITVGTATR